MIGHVTAQTVADLGEHLIIDRIRHRVGEASPSVLVPIGDDAAVLTPERGSLTVVTTDCLVESVHFDRAFCPMDAIGHKALSVNLSDLAAMGAAPQHALLSLVLPPSLPVLDLDSLLEGLLRVAKRHQVDVVGGNIACAVGPLVIDITALGSVRRRRILTRAGARPGDLLYVSGELGAAAAGLGSLHTVAPDGPTPSDDLEVCRDRYLRPEARIRLGVQLGRNRAARACIDLSDGLADGVRQIAKESTVGAIIRADAIPIARGAREWFERQGLDVVIAAIASGDDYELLFASPPDCKRRIESTRRRSGKPPLTVVGVITREPACILDRNGAAEPLPHGYRHCVGPR